MNATAEGNPETGGQPLPPSPDPGARLDPDLFDLLTFDCYGTLVDWETGIIEGVQAVCASHGRSATDAAILKAFGDAEHVVQGERYRIYREVLALTLVRLGSVLGFRPTGAECDAFAASVADWPPFPDTVQALRQLGARFRLGIVSNVDDDLFADTRKRLDIDFDWVVTAQQVGSYKPATAHFEEMATRSGIARERALHVAQSLYHDIAPASALGYATVHVNRKSRGGATGATPSSTARPDAEVPDMAGLAELLLGDR
ncbi:MAG: HAD-IA family hydrolase [Gemmatimonadota bacterium]|nr:HAD-IA family hydrolase [Gemmatimonadota bacterium]